MHGISAKTGEEDSDDRYIGYDTGKATLFKIAQIVIASDFKVWPDAGGLLDQDATIMTDLSNLLLLYHRRRPVKKEEGSEESADQGFPIYTQYLH